MTRLPRPPESFFDGTPPPVRAYLDQSHAVIDQLMALVEMHESSIAALEAQLQQNSSNSSKPPSSDGPHVTPAPPEKPSGKTRGGQPGHPRHERVILPPDEVSDHEPTRRRRCAAAALVGDDPNPILDQVLDLPAKLRHVVHHRRHTLACPCCHARTTARCPRRPAGSAPS